MKKKEPKTNTMSASDFAPACQQLNLPREADSDSATRQDATIQCSIERGEAYRYLPTRILCISTQIGKGWKGRINVFTGSHYHYSVHSKVERLTRLRALDDARLLAKEVILR